jgi:hypothetical protein
MTKGGHFFAGIFSGVSRGAGTAIIRNAAHSMRDETMKAVSAVIYSLYRDTPRHSDWVIACLTGAWCGILGERVAAACRPVSLRGTELVVEVTDRAWFPPLSGMKDELLRLVRTATGGAVRQLTLTMRRES